MRRSILALGFAAVAGYLLLTGRRHDLRGKHVLVTGGARGLGLQLAREAAARGARLGLCARSADELAAAAAEFSARGVAIATARCDVRDDASVRAAIAELEAALGPVDVLANVAGIIGVGPVEALTIADFEDAVETNLLGAVRASLAVLPAMRARRDGAIVNVTSLGGEIAIPHMLPYCASKFGFVGFSDGLHAEVARDGVRVTTVVPGLMRTGSPPNATFAGQPEKEYAIFAASDATALTAVSVQHAARVIWDGYERGAARVVISVQARAALALAAIAPRLVRFAMTVSGYTLPRGGDAPEHRLGRDSESAFARSPLFNASHDASREQREDVDPPVARDS